MSVILHYSEQTQYQTIIEHVATSFPAGPTPFQLAAIDQLHIGGVKASEKLIRHLLQPDVRDILEIGSGLGGLARLLHSQASSPLRITCVDITHGLNHLNSRLCQLCRPPVSPLIITADGQHLPIQSQQFDRVVLQHSLLNIPDKLQTLAEIKRVLRPGGQLILHEVVTGNAPGQLHLPVPWASSTEQSQLISLAQLQQQLSSQGFRLLSSENWSAQALAWRQRKTRENNLAKPSASTPSLSPALILGDGFMQMATNVQTNLEQGLIEVVELVAAV